MAVAQVLLLAAVLLHCTSAVPASSESCTHLSPDRLNCSSSGLSSVPQPIPDSVTELDLTNNLLDSVTFNRPHYHLKSVRLGNNSITHLSLCMERNSGSRYVTGRQLLQMRTWRRRGCVPWAPSLQLLSAERNQLQQLPEGLESSAALQVLQLSFNRISTLQPGQLSHLRQLKELHLQHNRISSLHPQMFKDLARLQVLDLSFNMLTSLHPLMYLSLHNLGANVRLAGNRWKCDCSMRSVRRRMVYDSSRGMHAWSLVCASPSNLSGRDLLQLEDDDLNCVTTERGLHRHQDVTVFSGSEILLSCSTQDSMEWTPRGQASVNEPEAGLFITDIAERDTGLYVCVSEEQEVVSVFNLQISKVGGAHRKARSLPESSQQIISQSGTDQERAQAATQSDLALAVCLSILFTFLVAFILGVLARPCVDVLWKRITKKKSVTVTNTVSNVEQGQYDNEAYCDIEDPEMVGGHRERRVTFSTIEVREDANVQYYDTVARDQDSANDDSMLEYETVEGLRERARDSESDGRRSPDKRRHSSSSSNSSLSDKGNIKEQTRPKSPQLVEESVQQRANISTVSGDLPHISIESTHEIPGFSSEPFAGWSPHADHTNLTNRDQWQDNEEQFEFSDSVQSISPRSSSVIGSFNDSKLLHKQKKGDTSSSSSYLSENETTHYTVNSDKEEEDDIRPSLGFNHGEPGVRKTHSSSSSSSDSDEEGHKVKQAIGEGEVKVKSDKLSSSIVTAELENRDKVKPIPQTRRKAPSIPVSIQGKSLQTGAPSPHSSSSSSDSDQAPGQTHMTKLPLETYPTGGHAPSTQWPTLDLGQATSVKRRLDIKVKPQATDTSSSSSSEDETTKTLKRPGTVDLTIQKPSTTVSKLHSNSSSSSDSEDESSKPIKKHEQGQLLTTSLPLQGSQTVAHNLESGWPVLNLQHLPRIKRRLDIKVKKTASESSSSSSSEDETRISIKRPGVGVTNLQNQKSPTVPVPLTDSSSSSDSEDEATNQIQKQELGQMHTARLPLEKSPNLGHVPQAQWPLLDLGQTTSVKRRLDIKVKSQATDTSSSSDSEDDKTNSLKRPETVHLTTQAASKSHSDSSSSSDSEDDLTKHVTKLEQGQLPKTSPSLKGSQTVAHNLESGWPVLNLQHLPRIKRRLDIKVQKPDSDSSSSDSENETKISMKRPGVIGVTQLASQKSSTEPKLYSESSSSSDSEDEARIQIEKQELRQTQTARLPLEKSPNFGHVPQAQWPLLDLGQTTSVKRRLDIKVKSQATDTSSSSDSEDDKTNSLKRPETVHLTTQAASKSHSDSSSSSDSEDDLTKHVTKLEQGQLPKTSPSLKGSQTVAHNLESGWPVLNLQHLPRIKRRLDIKVQKPDSDSSSSDSENETKISMKRPGVIGVTQLASQKSSTEPKLYSESSSSSDSEDEARIQIEKQELRQTQTARLPLEKSPNFGHVPQAQWPLLDLGQTTSVKRRLDIKVKSRPTDTSSSSSSEDETTNSLKRPGTVDLTIQKNQAVPKSHSDSSSSSDSDSEDDPNKTIRKQEPGQLLTTSLPLQGSQTVAHNLESGWPVLNLQHLPRIKRRLDIKAPKPASESSSSSSSEDETKISVKRPGNVGFASMATTKSSKVPDLSSDSSSSSDSEVEATNQIKTQELGQMHTARLPLEKSPNFGHVPQAQWPLLDLGQTTSVKRRLDIKVKSQATDTSSSSSSEDETTNSLKRPGTVDLTIQKPSTTVSKLHSDSSSSSDSEDESSKPIKKHEQGQLLPTSLPLQGSQTVAHNLESGWPVLNLQHLPRIKRRLDIKAPKPASDSSSSSSSEDETKISIKRPGNVGLTSLATSNSSKVPNLSSDSSSSSDSEVEATNQILKQELGQMHTARLPLEKSPKVGHVTQTQWPLLDLGQTTSVKRRLDIKVKSQATDTSSSSDSEDETTNSLKRPGMVDFTIQKPSTTVSKLHSNSSSSSDSEDEPSKPIKKHEQGQLLTTSLPLKGSQTVAHNLESGWPVLNLQHLPRIKRRLDIKAPKPASESSSSSDSEDETRISIKRPVVGVTILQTQKPPTAPLSDSSSSSDSEDEATKQMESGWPVLNLHHLPRIKRRLDIKAPKPASDLSSSSDSEDEANKPIHEHQQDQVHLARPSFKESITVSRVPQTQWPLLDFEHTASIKRRLDIKVQSTKSDSSSSSDSEDEERNHPNKQEGNLIHLSSSDESQGRTKDLHWKVEGDSTYVGITSRRPGSVSTDLYMSASSYKPHLSDVKSPGPQRSTSSSSSSESEDENMDRTKLRLEATAISMTTEREVIESPKSPVIDIPLSPKTDPNFKLQKYNIITDEHDTTTPKINPELESRWATMNLGISRFRKRLEITSRAQEPPKVPLSPPPVSSSSSSSESEDEAESGTTKQKREEVGIQGIKYTGSSQKPEITPVTVSPILKSQEGSLGTVDLTERWERPLEREASSSSDSGSDRIDYRVPDLSLGVPRIKRRLNVLAPPPQPRSSSSSSSDSETKVTEYSAKQSRPVLKMPQNRDTDTLITYKRSIFQTPSPTSSSPPFTSQSLYDSKQRYSEVDHDHRSYSLRGNSTASDTKRFPSRSFNDLLKMVSPSKSTELPPELKWTGVGRQMPDMPVFSPVRRLDVGFSSTPADPELPPPSSSSSSSSESDDEIKQDRANSDVTREHKYSSLSAITASSASATTFDTIDNSSISTNQIGMNVSDEKRERRGLSALKIMSSEIKQWDINNEYLETRESLVDDPGVETGFHYQRSKGYTESMATQSYTKVHLPSASVNERRLTDMSYGIPSYRRHGIGGIDPQQETPPPIPSTPPPSDEAMEFTWKSRANSWKQRSEGTGYYLRQSRYTVGTDPSSLTQQNLEDFLDTSKNPITEV